MKRPILFALAFLMGGVMMGFYADMRMALLFILGMGVLCFCLYKTYRYKPVFIFFLFALIGSWRMGQSLREPLESPVMTTLTGIVKETGVTASGNGRLVVVAVLPSGESARLMAYLKPGMEAEAGQEITFEGLLYPLSKPTYPGAYNEFQILRTRKIKAKIFPDTIETGERINSPALMLYTVRHKLAAVYSHVLPPKEAGVVRSVVLGVRDGLDDEIADLYRLAGIYHILSISGLHIAILMLAVKRLLEAFMPERQAAVVALAVMVLYCLMTGAAVSTVRALTMCSIGIGAKIWFRDYDLISSTAFACIALLLYEPLYLFNVGFQLSFSAVFGIAILTAPMEYLLTLIRFPFNRYKNAVAVCAAAMLATYPVLSFHFYTLSTYSLFANLIIVPTVVVLVVIGALVGIIGLFWLPGGLFLSGVLFYLLRFYEMTCRFFDALPFSVINTGCCGLAVVASAYGVLLLFAYSFSGMGNIRLKLRGLIVGSMVLAICIFLRVYPPGWEMTVLDEVSILRHKRSLWVAGNKDAYPLSRYLDYIGIMEYTFLSGDTNFHMGDTTVSFKYNMPVAIEGRAYIINSGNRWERAAIAQSLAADGGVFYDTATDGAIRVYSTGKTVKIFANYNQ